MSYERMKHLEEAFFAMNSRNTRKFICHFLNPHVRNMCTLCRWDFPPAVVTVYPLCFTVSCLRSHRLNVVEFHEWNFSEFELLITEY